MTVVKKMTMMQFCKNCGKPLGSNKTKQSTSKLKIIIPNAIIVILLIIAGTMFMNNNNTVSSDSKNNNLENTDSENNNDLTGYDNLLEILSVTGKIDDQNTGNRNYSAIITIEFSHNKNMAYIKHLSIDNLNMSYNDESSIENQHVNKLQFKGIDGPVSYISRATTNPLNNETYYNYTFSTTCESSKKHKPHRRRHHSAHTNQRKHYNRPHQQRSKHNLKKNIDKE